VNEPDFDHLSFVSVMLSQIIQAGGAQIGDITDFGAAEKPFLIVYARHPEGDVLELEQIWIVWSVTWAAFQTPGTFARLTCHKFSLGILVFGRNSDNNATERLIEWYLTGKPGILLAIVGSLQQFSLIDRGYR